MNVSKIRPSDNFPNIFKVCIYTCFLYEIVIKDTCRLECAATDGVICHHLMVSIEVELVSSVEPRPDFIFIGALDVVVVSAICIIIIIASVVDDDTHAFSAHLIIVVLHELHLADLRVHCSGS